MERFIRPFVPWVDTHGKAFQFKTSAATDNAVIEWTASTSVNVETIPALYQFGGTKYPNSDEVVMSRKTHDERIENPEDPEQYVDVEVPEVLKLKGAFGWRQLLMEPGYAGHLAGVIDEDRRKSGIPAIPVKAP